MDTGHPPRGRQRQAERNDALVLRAAREAFAELGWDAPVSDIARRAGVGMGSLYRRYGSKEDLVQRIREDGAARSVDALTAAMAAEPDDPWAALVRYLRSMVAGGPVSTLPALGGRLPATPLLDATVGRLRSLLTELLRRCRRAGAVRDDVRPSDLVLVLQLAMARFPCGEPARADALRLRYLDVMLAGLRAGAAGHPLRGPAPTWPELNAMWNAVPD